MRLLRYAPSFRGIKAIRSSREVDEHLERRAQRVADTADNLYDHLGLDVPVDVLQEGSDTRAPRARVAVIARSAAALRIEGEHRVLGSALDAARG